MVKGHDCLSLLGKAKSVELPALENDMYHTGLTPSLIAGFEGACFMHLGQPKLALDALNQELALIDPIFRLNQCLNTADRGKVYAQLGDPKKACELFGQVLNVIVQTRSVNDLKRVYKAKTALKPWKNSAEVQKLNYRLDQTVKALKQRTTDS